MKICDKCGKEQRASYTILIVEDDTRYDLCQKHKEEVTQNLESRDKTPLFGKKRTTAKK